MKRWVDDRSGRDVWLLTAASVDAWPAQRPWDSERFGLLVATDHVVDARRLAQQALAQGLAVVAACGPGCDEIEGVFDLAIVGDGSIVEPQDDVILTTSHPEESLEDVLAFFLEVLVPSRDHVDRCTTWVVFAVGAVAGDIERLLDDRARLARTER